MTRETQVRPSVLARAGAAAKGALRSGLKRVSADLPARDDVAFALYTAPTALLTLWLAMWLQLDAPYWAGSTVLITAQISRSQSLLKGFNRLIGTSIGVVVAVVLIGLAPQGWWSLLSLETAWLMLCTFVSCLLRNQRSYAAALSGFTALIVLSDSFGKPEHAFSTAVSRGSAVFLGVAMFVAATRVLTPRMDVPNLRRVLTSLLADGLGLVQRLLRGEADAGDVARFVPRVTQLDDLLENGVTAARWLVPRKAALRGAVLALADAVFAALAMRDRMPAADRASAAALLGTGGASRAGGVAATLADNVGLARSGIALLQRDGVAEACAPVRRSLDRNYRVAARGALRTGLGMGSACTIWICTRWPSGNNFVLVVGILCCLFASRPSPVVGTRRFTLSTGITAALALWIGFFVLPDVSGFGALAVVLFPFLFIGALGVRSQRYNAFFTPLNFFLMSMIGIQNEMSYDPLSFFNSVEALVLGALYASLWFVVLPPIGEDALTQRLRDLLARTEADTLRDPPRRLIALERLGTLLSRVPEQTAQRMVKRAGAIWANASAPPPPPSGSF